MYHSAERCTEWPVKFTEIQFIAFTHIGFTLIIYTVVSIIYQLGEKWNTTIMDKYMVVQRY